MLVDLGPIGWAALVFIFGLPLLTIPALIAGSRLAIAPLLVFWFVAGFWWYQHATEWEPPYDVPAVFWAVGGLVVGWALLAAAVARLRRLWPSLEDPGTFG